MPKTKLTPYKVFDITTHSIKASVDCHIQLELDKENPPFESSDLIESSGVLNFFVDSEDIIIPLTYPYPIKIYKTGDGVSSDINGTKMTIHYKSGSLITDQKQYEKKTDVMTIKSLLTGQAKSIKDPKTITLLLADQIPNADLTHIELIVSTLYRINNGSKPARLTGNYDKAEVINPVTKVINDSWLSAMAFRDINKGIANGLVKGEQAKANPIEKIINQDFTLD